jgi:hypothetical protein
VTKSAELCESLSWVNLRRRQEPHYIASNGQIGDEMERKLNEADIASSTRHPGNFKEEMRNTTKDFRQDMQWPVQD